MSRPECWHFSLAFQRRLLPDTQPSSCGSVSILREWHVTNDFAHFQDKNGDVKAALQLEDDAETRQMWNFKYVIVSVFA